MARADEALFADFVARRYRPLVASAYLLLGDQGHAEDLVQTALYRTFRNWPKLRDPAAAESYTRKTMVRLSSRWRTRRWSAEIPVEVARDDRAYHDPLDARAQTLDLMNKLSLLSMQHRTVLVLRFFDDLSETECAEILKCPVGTVKSRTSRALNSLRGAVEHDSLTELQGDSRDV